MLDRPIRRIIDPALERVARGMPISANSITLVGFVIGLGSSLAIVYQLDTLALTMLLLNRLADGLDGAVARHRGSTDLGGYLDITLDMLWYSSVPLAFALRDSANTLPAAFLIYSFVGTGASFLAFAVIAAKRRSAPSEKKSFVYSIGLMEGTETIAFFVAFCWWPTHFPILAWIFGCLCWLTTLLRIITSVQTFREPAS